MIMFKIVVAIIATAAVGGLLLILRQISAPIWLSLR
jgi:hypothetical protein